MTEVEKLKLEISNLKSQLNHVKQNCTHPNPRCVRGSYENRAPWKDMKCDLCGEEWMERDQSAPFLLWGSNLMLGDSTGGVLTTKIPALLPY